MRHDVPGDQEHERSWLRDMVEEWRELTTERAAKEISVYCGGRIGRVRVEAARRDGFDVSTSFSCTLVEVDGDEVFKDERKEEKIETDCAPTPEEQQQVLLRALGAKGLYGNPVCVSESAAGKLRRLIETQKHLARKRR